jgi:uncharacterized membrane protein YhhN
MSHLWLAVLCLLLMTAFIVLEHRERWVAGVILKGAASLCFVALGILGSKGAADTGFSRLVVAGLAVGAVADVVLNLRYVFTQRAKLLFAGGTLVFLAGHVLYSVAVWPRATMPWLFVALGVVATALVMRAIFSHITAEGSLKVIGVFYVGIVVILNCLALSALIARHDAQSLVFLAGALLFLASDIILILNTFGGDFQFRRRALNLSLYYVGQVLIALSLGLG